MQLIDILKNVEYEIIGNKSIKEIEITNMDSDSRNIKKDGLFVAVEGMKYDGHTYIENAINNGAKVILVTKEIQTKDNIIYIKIKNSRSTMPIIANNFFNFPSKKLKVIGVTGTKGKTTTTYMLKHIFEEAGYKTGLIGTIANYIGNKKEEASRTTPQPIEIQKMFYEMVNEGIDIVIMEVSSHALDLHRVDGIDFDVGVFTNLSQDHLDYHITFENYYKAKEKLFTMCKYGVINIDDEYGKRLYKDAKCEKSSIGIYEQADYKASNIQITSKSTTYKLNDNTQIILQIPGEFSAYNSLYAIAVAKHFNIENENIIKGLKETNVPGRAQIVKSNKDFAVMVDYAHSPASLESILKSIKVYCKGKIICVFGCGGDRDNTKRPLMAKISGELADYTVLTSDNPRTEEPLEILKQVESGIKYLDVKYEVIEDRYKAIKHAIEIAQKDDIVLIAGKGQETYQELKDKTIHFDDVETAKEILDNM